MRVCVCVRARVCVCEQDLTLNNTQIARVQLGDFVKSSVFFHWHYFQVHNDSN